MISPCSLHVYCPPSACYEAYDISLLSICLCILPVFFFFLFSVQSVSYQSRRLVLPRTSCSLLNCIQLTSNSLASRGSY
jgi:hypothetical protein